MATSVPKHFHNEYITTEDVEEIVKSDEFQESLNTYLENQRLIKREELADFIEKHVQEALEQLKPESGNERTNRNVQLLDVPVGAVVQWPGLPSENPLPPGYKEVKHLGMRNGHIHIQRVAE